MARTPRVPLSGQRVPIGALQPIARRSSFVYLDRCVVHRDSNAVVALKDEGSTYLPAASIAVLQLGPGTRITHQAMHLLAESGVVTCWVGESGSRLYASAPALSQSTRLLEAQARLVTRRTTRLAVARQMYQMRFPGENVSRATMQQLRGMEGARVRGIYRELATKYGVEWRGRRYDPEDSSVADSINRALSVANGVLYGLMHAVIVATGCSPGLGFVHTGHALSFVYDMADLYKAEISIPAAFEISADGPDRFESAVRRRVRERAHDARLLDKAVDDLHTLLGLSPRGDAGETALALFDEQTGSVRAGTNYADDL